jgi:hypothetical protein
MFINRKFILWVLTLSTASPLVGDFFYCRPPSCNPMGMRRSFGEPFHVRGQMEWFCTRPERDCTAEELRPFLNFARPSVF